MNRNGMCRSRAVALRTAGVMVFMLAGTAQGAWVESLHGDAGEGTPTSPAQVITAFNEGGDNLTVIRGETDRAAGDLVDAYVVEILDPMMFEATTPRINSTLLPPEALEDPRLFIFNMSGFGLLGNDNEVSTPEDNWATLTSMSTDGTGIMLMPGTYIIAIAGDQLDPSDDMNREIFRILSPFTEVSGPDGDGGGAPLDRWVDNTPGGGLAFTGEYEIQLSGVVPTPGVLGMVTAAGLVSLRRRR